MGAPLAHTRSEPAGRLLHRRRPPEEDALCCTLCQCNPYSQLVCRLLSLNASAQAGASAAAIYPDAVSLLQFKSGTTNRVDVLASWTRETDNPCTPPIWDYVTCEDGHVVAL